MTRTNIKEDICHLDFVFVYRRLLDRLRYKRIFKGNPKNQSEEEEEEYDESRTKSWETVHYSRTPPRRSYETKNQQGALKL